ncbi:MAG: ABC transporter ATP-binding protein/permease [Treponema sp.]|nr:ABC transporter ATP-binding protein/permease [Treponema sp.]
MSVSLFLGSILTIVLPNYLKLIIDNITDKHYDMVKRLLVHLSIAVVINSFFYMLSSYIFNYFIQKIQKNEKNNIYYNLLTSNYASINNFNTGSIINYFKYDLPTLTELEMGSLPSYIFNGSKILIIIFLLFRMDKELAFIFILIVPVLFIVLLFSAKYMKKNFKEYKSLNDEEINIIDNDYQNIEQIKTNNILSKYISSFKIFSGRFAHRIVVLDTLSAAVNNTFEFVSNIFMVIIFFIGIKYIVINKISIGSLIAFYSYFQVIVPSIQYLSNFNADLIKYNELKQSIKNIFTIQRETDKSNFSLPKEFDIVFENVSLQIKSKIILDKISFKIKYGSKVALVGRNGSGKTSITRLLTCIYKKSNGGIFLNGIDIDDYSVYDVRKRIGIVHQTPLFLQGTIEDNITLFGQNNNHYWSELKEDSYLKNLFNNEIHGYDDGINTKKVGLSLGQQKIIALCRILLQDPSIVILDEFFSNLDDKAKEFSLKHIKRHFKHKTVISITHDKYEIEKYDFCITIEKKEV